MKIKMIHESTWRLTVVDVVGVLTDSVVWFSGEVRYAE